MSPKAKEAEYMEQPAKRWEFASLEEKVAQQTETLKSATEKLDIIVRTQVTSQYIDERLKMHATIIDDKFLDHKKEIDSKYGLIRIAIITIASLLLTAMVTTAITWVAQHWPPQ